MAMGDDAARWVYAGTWRLAAVSGLTGLLVAVALTLAVGWPPAPSAHDEFSYLLASDTFTHGRLTNQTHPFWEHFESFHILQVPTYASKYPPAVGLLLALGQRTTGEPIVGVWLGYAFMCAAISWMLLGWTRPRWALWGGIVCALWFAGLHMQAGYWAVSYWGGALCAAGGALVVGGVRRITHLSGRQCVTASIALGAGLILLANTRPFEGFLSVVPVGVAVMVWVARRLRGGEIRRVTVALGPALSALAVAATFVAYYNYRVTGHAADFPYMEYEKQYASSPVGLFSEVHAPPVYRHQVIRCFYLTGGGHNVLNSWPAFYFGQAARRTAALREGFLPFFAVPLLLFFPAAVRRKNLWLPFASIGCVLLGFAATPWYLLLHYAAPVVGAYFLMLTVAAQSLRTLRIRGAHVGRFVQRLVLICVLLSAGGSIVAFRWVHKQVHARWQWQRADMERRLSAMKKRQIVLIEYGPQHSGDAEWVYNSADIDSSPVVWARSMSATKDLALLQYFENRRAWHLVVDNDAGPFRLEPLDRASLARAAAAEPAEGAATSAPSAPSAPSVSDSPDGCRK